MHHSSPKVFYTVMLTSEPQVEDVHDINPPGILSTKELIREHKEAIARHAILLPPPPAPAPPPPPSSKEMIKTPLPSIPNNSIKRNSYNCWIGGRLVGNKNYAGGGCHPWWKWQEKKVNNGGERRRWKNNRGDYQQILKLNPVDNPTTIMIRNIPNRYTRELLLQTLDNHCKIENDVDNNSLISAYDFVYLPIDFQRRVNAGFAFVNFTNTKAALRFRDAFSGKRWDLFESKKTAEITKAKIQGRKELVKSLEERNFLCGSEEDLPVWFEPARDGSGRVESKMNTVGKCLLLGKKK